MGIDKIIGKWPGNESDKKIAEVMSDTYGKDMPTSFEDARTGNHLQARIAALEAELAEQARLHGKGSEREAALLARLAEAEKREERAYRAGWRDGSRPRGDDGGMTSLVENDAWLAYKAGRGGSDVG